MSPTVGAPPADPQIESSPEGPIAGASAALSFRQPLSHRPRGPWIWLELALWTVAAASALLICYTFADRAAFGSRESRRLDSGRQLVAAVPATAVRNETAAPALQPFVARLEIPAIGLAALVVDGVDARTLRRAVGRMPGSSHPGEPGDVALAGHRDTDFRALDRVAWGDLLLLRTVDGDYQYEVESIRIVPPESIDVLLPQAYPTLTLITCYPFHYVGPAPLRYIVRAREIARARPAAAGRGSLG